jgi:hypothetical protein
MKKEFGHIYLSWRQGSGHRRHIVGVIKNSVMHGVTFSYIKEAVDVATQQGFIPYTEFPKTDVTYSENVVEIFGARLTKSERSDIADFYKFWEISEKRKDDKLCLLAHTQGFLPTDNFEFLADYLPVKDLAFLTDLAGVSHLKLSPDTISEGDELRFEKESTNPKDPKAIKVFKGETEIGYIKKIHVNVFHKKHCHKLKITVKALDKNGVIKRIFVKVSF